MKKFLKIAGVLLLLFFGIMLILYVILRIKFPAEKIQRLVIEGTYKQMHRKLTLNSLRINPLTGLTLKDLTLYDTARFPEKPFITLESVQLKYRFWSIFKKRIEINKIVLKKPRLFIRRNENGRWNFEDLTASGTDSLRRAEFVSSTPELPGFLKHVSFQLHQFEITDAGLTVTVEDSQGYGRLKILPVSARLSDFLIKKIELPEAFKNLAFRLSASSKNGLFKTSFRFKNPMALPEFSVRKIEASGTWRFQAEAKTGILSRSAKSDTGVRPPSKVVLNGAFGVLPAAVKLTGCAAQNPDSVIQIVNRLPEVSADLQGVVDLAAPAFSFPDIRAKVGNFLTAALQITGDSLLTAPKAVLSFKEGWVDLRKLGDYCAGLSLLGKNPAKIMYISGRVDFSAVQARAKITKKTLRFSYRVKPEATGVFLRIPKIALNLKNFTGGLTAAGNFLGSGFISGILKASFRLPDVHAAPAESLRIAGKNIRGAVNLTLGKNFVPKQIKVSFDADSLQGARVSSYSEFEVSSVPSLKDLKIQDFDGSTEFHLDGFDVGLLSAGRALGHVTVSGLLAANYGMNAFVRLKMHSADLQYLTAPGVYERLPELTFVGKGNLKSTPGFQEFSIKNFRIRVNDFVQGTLTSKLLLSQRKAEVHLKKLQVDLAKIRPFLPSGLKETLQFGDWKGNLNGHTDVFAAINPKTDSLKLAVTGGIQIHLPYFINMEWLLNVDGVDLQADFSGSMKKLQTRFRGTVKSALLKDVLAVPFENTTFTGEAALLNLNAVYLKNFRLRQPDLHLAFQANGSVGSLSAPFPHLNIRGHFAVQSSKYFPAVVGINMSGDLNGNIFIKSDSVSPQIVTASGNINLLELNIQAIHAATLKGIRGTIPFQAKVNAEEGLLIPGSRRLRISLPLYPVFQPYYFKNDTLFRTITIDTIRVFDYELTNLTSDIRIKDSFILLPNTKIDLYNGNLVSQMWLNLGTGRLKDISYEISAQMARVNSARFPGLRRKKRKASQITASLHFKGKGLNIKKAPEVQGGVEVTEIGPATTDNLLRSLDPKGLDKSIRQARQLIRFGAKPRLISFQIRHGNMYPTIWLSQPWYSPFKISGGKVSLVRIPLSFVLNMMLQSAEPIP